MIHLTTFAHSCKLASILMILAQLAKVDRGNVGKKQVKMFLTGATSLTT